MDQRKATKYIGRGFLVAILFIAIMGVSIAINAGRTDWSTWQYNRIEDQYDWGDITLAQRNEQRDAVDFWVEVMHMQNVIISPICRFGMNIALAFVFVGLIGLAFTGTGDEKTRRLLLLVAGILLFFMVFTMFFDGFGFTVTMT
ncbi:MAG: hypothetical protein JXA99_13040 [Candidatus Lokiarchaeota archaeon]|nr:hypothetical protein [Candidatus Lokiarchaeota archaeon]